VLHTRPWRETSLLIDWFTETHGRVTAKLQGARQVGRRAKGRPMPFQCLDVQFTGRGDIRTVAGVENHEPPRSLTGRALAAGFYCNELLIRAVHRGEPMPELFAAYWGVMSAFERTSVRDESTLALLIRSFERDLLMVLGVGFDWTCVADSGVPLDPERRYWVLPEHGILDQKAPSDHAHGIMIPVSGRVLLAIAADEPLTEMDDRRSARDLMRRLLVEHVGSKPFQSRQLWQAMAD